MTTDKEAVRVDAALIRRVNDVNEAFDMVLARDGMTEMEFYNNTTSLAVKDAYKFARALRVLLSAPPVTQGGEP